MRRRCGGRSRRSKRRVAIEHVLEVPPVRLRTVPGFETAVFPYTTDIPFLSAWGEPLLFGPGSIHVAHTADEFVSIAELTCRGGPLRHARESAASRRPERLQLHSHHGPA